MSMVVVAITVVFLVVVASVVVAVLKSDKARQKSKRAQLVKLNLNTKNEEIARGHYLDDKDTDHLAALDQILGLPSNLVAVQDKIIMTLTLSNDEAVRLLATKFFEISDDLHNILHTGLIDDLSDSEYMLDYLREKYIALIANKRTIEELIADLKKTEDNIKLLNDLAIKRSNGDHSRFKKLDLDSWSNIISDAIDNAYQPTETTPRGAS